MNLRWLLGREDPQPSGTAHTDAYIHHLRGEVNFLRDENTRLREELLTALAPKAKAEVEFYRANRQQQAGAQRKPPEDVRPLTQEERLGQQMSELYSRAPWAAELVASGHIDLDELAGMTHEELEEAARQREENRLIDEARRQAEYAEVQQASLDAREG